MAGVAVVMAGLAALMFLGGVLFPGCCFAVGAAVLAIVTAPVLSGRVGVGTGELETRADPAKTYTLPWREISAVETRRRLLTEVVAVRRGDVWLELGAPRRWRFRDDPAFAAAAADIARRAGVDLARGGRRTPAGKLVVRVPLAVVYVVVFVFLDPVWHSPLWPGRHEATVLPPACAALRPAAAEILGSARPRQSRIRGSVTGEDTCAYDGATLTLRYMLYRYAPGQDGGIEHARRDLLSGMGLPDDAKRIDSPPVPGPHDQAVMFVASGTTQIAARRANVVVQLAYRPRAGHDTSPTARMNALAGTALSRITLR